MTCRFQVGDKVVFVPRGDCPDWGQFSSRPWPGEIYTVAEITIGTNTSNWDGPPELAGLRLEEIIQPRPRDGIVVNWDYRDFQPVKILDIDISIFTKMLTPELESA